MTVRMEKEGARSLPAAAFLILVNLRVYHAKMVKAWLQDHKKQIEAFCLPPHSAELNPDEYLNCDLKQGVHSGPPARSKEQLQKKVHRHMKNEDAAKQARKGSKIFRTPQHPIYRLIVSYYDAGFG